MMGNKIFSYEQLREFWEEISDNDIVSAAIAGEHWEQLNRDVIPPALESMLSAASKVLNYPRVETLSTGANVLTLRDGSALDLGYVRHVTPLRKESKGTKIISFYMVSFSDGWQLRIDNDNMARNILIDRWRGAE